MDKPRQVSNRIWNVPNVLSAIRLVMALVVVAAIPSGWLRLGFVLFVIAAATDWIDGWWARRFDQVTQLGRILDPFCDKMIVCGAYICLAVEMRDFPWYASITGWMAVVVMGREMLVTALRSFIEQAGGDFSAKFVAKVKMLLQCIAIGAAFVALIARHDSIGSDGLLPEPTEAVPVWILVVLGLASWSALLTTLWSGAEYVGAAAKFLRQATAAANDRSTASTTENERGATNDV